MRYLLTGLCIIPVLALCACSGRASPSAFCTDVNAVGVKYASLQNQPTPATVKEAAQAMARLADEAPAPISSAMKTEAAAYAQWAKTGSNAPLTETAFSNADAQLGAWLHLNCKHH